MLSFSSLLSSTRLLYLQTHFTHTHNKHLFNIYNDTIKLSTHYLLYSPLSIVPPQKNIRF